MGFHGILGEEMDVGQVFGLISITLKARDFAKCLLAIMWSLPLLSHNIQ